MRQYLLSCFLVGIGLGLASFIAAGPPDKPAKAPVAETPYKTPAQPNEEAPETVYRLPPAEMIPDGVTFISAQTEDWSHKPLGIPEAHKIAKGKNGKLCILDTGFDPDHAEFRGRVKASKNFTSDRTAYDSNGHGTHTLGTAGAADDGEGTKGIAPEAELYVGKVLSNSGSGLTSWIAAGIYWAVDDCAVDVISMSLGSSSYDQRLHEAVKYAVSKGVVVVAAAGNEGPQQDTVGYPGGHPETICVGSIGQTGRVSSFSSRGPEVFLAAPGEQILATLPGNRYGRLSGTSMATPAVAGIVTVAQGHAKVKLGRRLTPAEVKAILVKTIADIDPAGRDTNTGYGLPLLVKVLGEIDKMAAPTPPPVDPPKPPVEPPVNPPTPGKPAVTINLSDLPLEKQKEILAKFPGFTAIHLVPGIDVIIEIKESKQWQKSKQ